MGHLPVSLFDSVCVRAHTGHYDSIVGPGYEAPVLRSAPGVVETAFIERVRRRQVGALGRVRVRVCVFVSGVCVRACVFVCVHVCVMCVPFPCVLCVSVMPSVCVCVREWRVCACVRVRAYLCVWE